jgi:chitinase
LTNLYFVLCFFLLQELREGFEDEAKRTGKQRLLLAAAVAGGEKIVRSAYDVPKIDK